jgi:lipoate-protein ligase A
LAAQLRSHAATLREVAGRDISFAEAAEAISQGFAHALRLSLQPSALTARERELASEIATTKRQEAINSER